MRELDRPSMAGKDDDDGGKQDASVRRGASYEEDAVQLHRHRAVAPAGSEQALAFHIQKVKGSLACLIGRKSRLKMGNVTYMIGLLWQRSQGPL